MTAAFTIEVTFAMALAFCAVHLFVGRLRFLDRSPRSAWLSFSGGVAVGYVFLHLLPELGEHGHVFAEATSLSGSLAVSWVYALALAGLALFYGMERLLQRSRGERLNDEGRNHPERGVFWLHIAASALLIAVVSYLLNHREDETLPGLALYFLAMMLHLLTADYGSHAEHPELYRREGRWALVAATLGGWATGLFVELPELALGGLFAFVGGAIILVVLKEELPENRRSRFWPFLGGAVVYAAMVLWELHLMG